MNRFSIFFLILLLILFDSCQIQAPTVPTIVETPIDWKAEKQVLENIPQVDYWWEVFEDDELNKLETLAIQQNFSLVAAAEKVAQARDIAAIVRSRLYPQVNLTPAFSNQDILSRLYDQGILSELQTNKTNKLKNKTDKAIREHQLLYSLPLSLSYEVDLWGRIRSEYEAASYKADSQAEVYQEMLLVLTTDLAIAYFNLRSQDTLLEVLGKVIEVRKKALKINQSRYEGQVDDYSAVALSKLELSNAEYQYCDAERIRTLYENQIAILIGIPASELTIEAQSFQKLPPKIPPSLPSEILLQRPDLAKQEFLMASIHKQIGAAYASYFPSVELTAGIGFSSPLGHDFLKWKSRYWGFGTDISQFIFDAGRREYNVKLTWAEFKQAAADYQQRVLVAFEEVEDALSNLNKLETEIDFVNQAVAAAHNAYEIAWRRYKDGVTNYIEVVDTERLELDNQEILVSLWGLSYTNTVQLIKALGGTWKQSNELVGDNSCGL